MAGLVPVILHGSMTPPLWGPSGVALTITPTIFIEGRPVATELSDVTPHGNFSNPHAPGFNPLCADSVIVSGAPRVLAGPEHLGVAFDPAECTCGFHLVCLEPAIKTYVGA